MNDKNNNRVIKILEIAQAMAKILDEKYHTFQVSNTIHEIEFHEGYAEPGYDSKTGIVLTGNWNVIDRWDNESKTRVVISNLPERLSKIFEKLGVDIEWSDEWSACNDCGKLFRTSPDSYSWKPSFVLGDGEVSCVDCVSSDPEDYPSSLEGDHEKCNTIKSIDPSEYGYFQFNENSLGRFNTNPKIMSENLKEKEIERFIFQIDDPSRTLFSVWVHESEKHKL